MSTTNDGGPAFPLIAETHDHVIATGMSLLDALAKDAMQALVSGHIAHYGHEAHWPWKDVASEAYDIAQAMLTERARRQA